ncbi:MAG: hypothetical protein U0736_22705 [Gemmataceae bacterium]
MPPVAPAAGTQGVQSDVAFDADAGTQVRLTAATGLWTAAVAGLICLALVAGQQLYLRQTWPSSTEGLRGLLGGGLAGLVGGAVGQLLFQLTAGTLGGEPLFRVVGWALLGGLAGLGLAFFIPNLRPSRGLLGGLAGGLAGAAGFLGVGAVIGGDVGGRVIGAVLLGAAIGLMVALAERVFRRVWLEVRYSPREQVSVTLGPEPVKIGSDARAAPSTLAGWRRWRCGTGCARARCTARKRPRRHGDSGPRRAADARHSDADGAVGRRRRRGVPPPAPSVPRRRSRRRRRWPARTAARSVAGCVPVPSAAAIA